MLHNDVPHHELQAFASELVDAAIYFNFEEYIRELYTSEQAAKEIRQVIYDLPLMTLPISICPWEPTSPLRTRQQLLSALRLQLKTFHVITTQAGLEHYWKTGQYGTKTLTSKEGRHQHFQHVSALLCDSPRNFSVDILPEPEQLLVNIQILDRKIVCLQNVYEFDEQGGLLLHDEELAQELIAYYERKLLAKIPEHLQGEKNVLQWFKKKIFDTDTG